MLPPGLAYSLVCAWCPGTLPGFSFLFFSLGVRGRGAGSQGCGVSVSRKLNNIMDQNLHSGVGGVHLSET